MTQRPIFSSYKTNKGPRPLHITVFRVAFNISKESNSLTVYKYAKHTHTHTHTHTHIPKIKKKNKNKKSIGDSILGN